MGGGGPDRTGRSPAPDLFDLGDHPALCGFRGPGERADARRRGVSGGGHLSGWDVPKDAQGLIRGMSHDGTFSEARDFNVLAVGVRGILGHIPTLLSLNMPMLLHGPCHNSANGRPNFK